MKNKKVETDIHKSSQSNLTEIRYFGKRKGFEYGRNILKKGPATNMPHLLDFNSFCHGETLLDLRP